jgi:hypothetical protein
MKPIYKLGKRPAQYDRRDLQFAYYRVAALPPYPAQFGHEVQVDANGWGMLGNGPDDSVAPGFQGAGDCVFAGADHETLLWTTEGGRPAKFTGANAIADYSAVTGYRPNIPFSDRGTQTRAALNYRRKTGILDADGIRHKIGAYLALEPGNIDHLLEALYLFGAVGIGLKFPNSAMDQFNSGQPWSVVPGAKAAGGHYVPLVAMRNYLVCVTWSRLQMMTWQFYKEYCDEAWAILSPEMLTAGVSPEGFNLAQLQADLSALG